MSLTRRMIADDFDATDEQIADLNTHKRQMLLDYRAQLAEAGMGKDEIKAEVEAVKKAIQRRRLITKDAAAVEAKDALVDEVLAEITARAPRATRAREIIDEFPPEADTKSTAARKDAPLISPADSSADSPVRAEPDNAVMHPREGTGPQGAGTQAPPVDTTTRKIRPHCLHPERCAGYGQSHCFSCSKAIEAA